MGIFGNRDLEPEDTGSDGATYDQALDFLVSLNDEDYKKVIKVADLYRKTHLDIAKITGLKPEVVPSIFVKDEPKVSHISVRMAKNPKEPDTEAGNFLDPDDELLKAFPVEDEVRPLGKTKKTKKTKINVKPN